MSTCLAAVPSCRLQSFQTDISPALLLPTTTIPRSVFERLHEQRDGGTVSREPDGLQHMNREAAETCPVVILNSFTNKCVKIQVLKINSEFNEMQTHRNTEDS